MTKIHGIILIQLFLSFSLFASCSCQRKNSSVETAKQDSSEPLISCLCPKDYRPVCGIDHVTYSNACSADCAKVKILHHGACLKETQQ